MIWQSIIAHKAGLSWPVSIAIGIAGMIAVLWLMSRAPKPAAAAAEGLAL